jgi:hypothetical protein
MIRNSELGVWNWGLGLGMMNNRTRNKELRRVEIIKEKVRNWEFDSGVWSRWVMGEGILLTFMS